MAPAISLTGRLALSDGPSKAVWEGGGIYALREMIDHMDTFTDFYEKYCPRAPPLVGTEDCESLFPHSPKKIGNR